MAEITEDLATTPVLRKASKEPSPTPAIASIGLKVN